MNGNGIWKWAAVSLTAFLLGLVPTYIYQLVSAPTAGEIDALEERETVLERRVLLLQGQVVDLRAEVRDLKGER